MRHLLVLELLELLELLKLLVVVVVRAAGCSIKVQAPIGALMRGCARWNGEGFARTGVDHG